MPAAVSPIAADWIDGHPLPDIRARHRDILPSIDAMAFADLIDKVIVQDLAWVLSSIISLWEHLASGPPLPSHLTCVPAMAKYGVADEVDCYAASIGVRNRADAIALARGYRDRTPDPFELPAPPGFPRFLAWATYLDSATLTGLVSAPTSNLLAERTAALSTPRQALALAATDNGTLTTPLRGIGPLGTRDQITTLRPGTELALIREPANLHDPNAIAVHLPSGPRLAYLPRPLVRILDTDDRSSCTATLTSAGAGEADPVTVTIHLNSRA